VRFAGRLFSGLSFIVSPSAQAGASRTGLPPKEALIYSIENKLAFFAAF
jgi:hypothetical protein